MLRVLSKAKILNFTTINPKATSDLFSTSVEESGYERAGLTVSAVTRQEVKLEEFCSFSLSAGSHWLNLKCFSLLQVWFIY